jgi:hypothetical protein
MVLNCNIKTRTHPVNHHRLACKCHTTTFNLCLYRWVCELMGQNNLLRLVGHGLKTAVLRPTLKTFIKAYFETTSEIYTKHLIIAA